MDIEGDKSVSKMTNKIVPLSELLQEPVSAVIEREQHTLDRLFGRTNGRIVLFGAGNLGRRAIAELRGIGVKPLCFCDNDERRWGSTIENCPVLSPSHAASQYGLDSLFVVTIWNAAHWYVETLAQLQRSGCRFISCYSPVYWRFPTVFLPFLLNDLAHKVFESASDVLAAEKLWSDTRSLDTYRSHVYWYATGDASHLPGRPDENSYFPADIFSISPNEVLVDCGAFDGDTIRQLTDRIGNAFQQVHAIEADPLSLGKLETSLLKMDPEIGKKIKIHRCAIGAERNTVRFEITGTVDSKICAEGGIEVNCLPLDDLFPRTAVTMIKMDIEGAEYDALRGAANLIQRDRPILAICVYHTQNDIWRIPLLVHEILPEHKLYLRAYEGDGFQTVMYAVPSERVV